MNKYTLFLLFSICVTVSAVAQYNPELDIRGTNDATDGGELQLATPSGNHFLRMFSGHNGDPNPFLFFNSNDVFRIATGDENFIGFTEWFTVRGNGRIGIHTDNPQTEFHINGAVTFPWSTSFYHYNSSFGPGFEHLLWLNRGWTGNLWDFTYLGGSGNRDNNVQAALILSHQNGILFGKGSNTADALSSEHMRLDENGNLGIGDPAPDEKLDVNGNIRSSSLIGAGDRNVVADPDGVLKIGSPQLKYLSLSGSAFGPSSDNNTHSWVSSIDGAYFVVAPPTYIGMSANVSLPHGSTIHQITVYYTDNDVSNGSRFLLLRMDNLTGGTSWITELLSSDSGYQGATTSTTIPIDNQRYAYAFSMQPTAGSGGGYMDSDFRIHQVIIEYSE